jgi:hypothetical protein
MLSEPIFRRALLAPVPVRNPYVGVYLEGIDEKVLALENVILVGQIASDIHPSLLAHSLPASRDSVSRVWHLEPSHPDVGRASFNTSLGLIEFVFTVGLSSGHTLRFS